MWTHYPELLQRPVPRYTSYPTAADFTDQVGAQRYVQALDAIEDGTPLSLYVHIPFCEEICWYCGCNTARSNKRSRLSAYLDSLHEEIALAAHHLAGRGRVQRISFGGGSPNAIEPLDFVRLVGDIIIAFQAEDPLISVEIDPRQVADDWISVLRSARVRYASMGVQTFDPLVQEAIGRVQPYEDVLSLTHKLRDAGVSSINFDLMYGLPHQDQHLLMETLEQTVSLSPDRIALFGYAHMPHIIPRQRRIDTAALPGEAVRFAMAATGHDFLVEQGYQPIGFDHFAKPDDPLAIAAREGRLHRNFQGFTDDESEHLIGFGASAISQLPGLYAQNAKNAGVYRAAVAEGHFPIERGVERDSESRRHGTLINDILCHGKAPLPHRLTQEQSETLEEFVQRGLVTTGAGQVHLRPAAAPYARTIAAIFDPRMAGRIGSFSAPV
ncbi:MAG: oxygen-independent coproporphyrinogen III oxidase [Sphingobium sp.]|nr:oxygen-independent coproporphyrinogen III oxidase [Sphingobium sp.]